MSAIDELTELLKVLSDATRQRIVDVLDGNELSVQELQQVLREQAVLARLAKRAPEKKGDGEE